MRGMSESVRGYKHFKEHKYFKNLYTMIVRDANYFKFL